MNDLFQNIDIIYFSVFRWDGPYSSTSIALAKSFSKNNRVFFINHPYTLRDYFQLEEAQNVDKKSYLKKNKIKFDQDPTMPEDFVSVTPPLTLPINWVKQESFHQFLYKINDRQLKKTLAATIKKYNIKKYIFINCFDPFYGQNIFPETTPILNIYQSVDGIDQHEYTRRHGPRLERQAVENADLTLTTSKELNRIQSQFSDQVFTLNNAADISIFRKTQEQTFERPEELKNIKTPIIGYTGNMDELRIDYELLKKIALAHSDKTLVMVGPVNNNKYKEIGLDKMDNVIFTGGKSINDLPKYLHFFDCALIPFLCNELTKSIYPLKINEYLAAGRSVISSNFSEDIQDFSSHIYLAKDHESFIRSIEPAISNNNQEIKQKRLKVAASNTWDARVEAFWQIVNPFLAKKMGSLMKQTQQS